MSRCDVRTPCYLAIKVRPGSHSDRIASNLGITSPIPYLQRRISRASSRRSARRKIEPSDRHASRKRPVTVTNSASRGPRHRTRPCQIDLVPHIRCARQFPAVISRALCRRRRPIRQRRSAAQIGCSPGRIRRIIRNVPALRHHSPRAPEHARYSAPARRHTRSPTSQLTTERPVRTNAQRKIHPRRHCGRGSRPFLPRPLRRAAARLADVPRHAQISIDRNVTKKRRTPRPSRRANRRSIRVRHHPTKSRRCQRCRPRNLTY